MLVHHFQWRGRACIVTEMAPAKWCKTRRHTNAQPQGLPSSRTFLEASDEEIDEKYLMASERASGAHAEQQRQLT